MEYEGACPLPWCPPENHREERSSQSPGVTFVFDDLSWQRRSWLSDTGTFAPPASLKRRRRSGRHNEAANPSGGGAKSFDNANHNVPVSSSLFALFCEGNAFMTLGVVHYLRRRGLIVLPAVLFALATPLFAAPVDPAATLPQIRFNRDIRPILSDNCFFLSWPRQEPAKGQIPARRSRLDPAEGGDRSGQAGSEPAGATHLLNRRRRDDAASEFAQKFDRAAEGAAQALDSAGRRIRAVLGVRHSAAACRAGSHEPGMGCHFRSTHSCCRISSANISRRFRRPIGERCCAG